MIKNILKTLKETDDRYDPIILKVIELVKGKTGLSDQRIAPVLLAGHILHGEDEQKTAVFILQKLIRYCERCDEYELCEEILNSINKIKNR